MASIDSTLAIDIGSTGLRIAEFEYPQGGGFIMKSFSHVEFTDQLTEANRPLVISAALRKALDNADFTTNKATIGISGQAAFMRFVKLPPVAEEEGRIKQIVEYEAKQNVPFPMEEVIWDYQLIARKDGVEDSLEVMFVVIKNDIVEAIIEAINEVGLVPVLVDFAPAALYNAARANNVGDSECVMVVNIGGRSTSLMFIDGDQFFIRTIPIAGYAITKQIAKEFGISIDEAEVLKRRHGFVALGGAYEEPESEVAATISKIIRNVMTRLHGEINRSISVYRTQQKGNRPVQLYLAGGSSTMAFTDHFLSEKLRMEVTYLNPFKIVTLSADMDVKALQEVAHYYAEVVGLGLRHSVSCPVEVGLIPESLQRQMRFAQRKPYLVACLCLWLGILGVSLFVKKWEVGEYRTKIQEKEELVKNWRRWKTEMDKHSHAAVEKTDDYLHVKEILEGRYAWPKMYAELILNKPMDVWITDIAETSGPDTSAPEPEGDEPEGDGFYQSEDTPGGGEGGLTWFTVTGQCVRIPGRPLYSKSQWAKLRKRLSQPRPNGNGDGAEHAPPPAVPSRPPKVMGNTHLPKVFVEHLRRSPMVVDNRQTRILSYSLGNKQISNLQTFTIQVQLVRPIQDQP